MGHKQVFIFISIGLGILTLWLNAWVIQHTLDYKNTKVAYADSVNFRARILDPDEWTEGEGAQTRAEASLALKESYTQSQSHARTWGFIVLGVLGAYVLLTVLWYIQRKTEAILLIGLFTLSILCLEVGLFAPMLEIAAYEQEVGFGQLTC